MGYRGQGRTITWLACSETRPPLVVVGGLTVWQGPTSVSAFSHNNKVHKMRFRICIFNLYMDYGWVYEIRVVLCSTHRIEGVVFFEAFFEKSRLFF